MKTEEEKLTLFTWSLACLVCFLLSWLIAGFSFWTALFLIAAGVLFALSEMYKGDVNIRELFDNILAYLKISLMVFPMVALIVLTMGLSIKSAVSKPRTITGAEIVANASSTHHASPTTQASKPVILTTTTDEAQTTTTTTTTITTTTTAVEINVSVEYAFAYLKTSYETSEYAHIIKDVSLDKEDGDYTMFVTLCLDDAAKYAAYGGEYWKIITDSFDDMTKDMQGYYVDVGHPEVRVVAALLNDLDESKYLYICENGKCVYNAGS